MRYKKVETHMRCFGEPLQSWPILHAVQRRLQPERGSSETLGRERPSSANTAAPDTPAGFRVPVNYCLRANPTELIPRVAVRSIWVGLDGGCLPFACSLQALTGGTGRRHCRVWLVHQKLPPSLLVLMLLGFCISSLRPVNYVSQTVTSKSVKSQA